MDERTSIGVVCILFLRGTELGAPGARILHGLRRRWDNGSFCEGREFRLRAQESLDNAILERMERDNTQASTRFERSCGLRQNGLERVEFAIYHDAQRLEGAGCGVKFPTPPKCGRNNVCQIGGGCKRLRGSSLQDRARNMSGLRLFAIDKEDARKLVLGPCVDDGRGRERLRLVVAHIQRPLLLEAEAARSVVHMRRAEPTSEGFRQCFDA